MTPERASILLRDDDFVGELDKIKQTYISQLINSSDHEVDVRENSYRMIRAVDAIIGHFQSIADTTGIKSKRLKIF